MDTESDTEPIWKYADPRMQRMCDWFRKHYCDPGHGAPYDSGEGGYQLYFRWPLRCAGSASRTLFEGAKATR